MAPTAPTLKPTTRSGTASLLSLDESATRLFVYDVTAGLTALSPSTGLTSVSEVDGMMPLRPER